MKLKRPYNWPYLGAVLRRRAWKEGAWIAEGLFLRGYHPLVIIRHANNDIVRAAAQHNDRMLHVSIGISARAKELNSEIERKLP